MGAVALGQLQDKSAISPLIDSLTTTHTRVVSNGLSPDATTAAFGTDGTFMKKGEGAELQVFHVQNQPVLDALGNLVALVGVSENVTEQRILERRAEDLATRLALVRLAARVSWPRA